MSTFKVGDKVKIVKKFNPDGSGIEWTTGMIPTINRKGEVLDVYDNHGSIQYLVRSYKDEWWYLEESLELLEGLAADLPKFTNREAFDNLQLKKGDRVTIISSATSFERAWNNSWDAEMDKYIGKTFELSASQETIVYKNTGLKIPETGFSWPYFVFAKVIEQQKQTVEKKDKYIDTSEYERISAKSSKKTGSKMVVDVDVIPETSVQSIVVTSTIVDTTSHLSPYLLLG